MVGAVRGAVDSNRSWFRKELLFVTVGGLNQLKSCDVPTHSIYIAVDVEGERKRRET